MADADDLTQTYAPPSSSSTDLGTEAMEKSGSDCGPSVQTASGQSRTNYIAEERLRAVARKYEIPTSKIKYLRKLKDFDIVILCDDSGSMKTPIVDTNRTRWDELREFVRLVVEVGTIFDLNGIDIHFLNRSNVHNITDPETVEQLFGDAPSGYTPLARGLQEIFRLPAAHRGHDKKLLVFIATDGAPTDDEGDPDLESFSHIMRQDRQPDTTHVMFLICTDEPTTVEYLREWDRTMNNVDVTDIFQKEKTKIRDRFGDNYPFSKGDYLVKILVGAIDPQIDVIDD